MGRADTTPVSETLEDPARTVTVRGEGAPHEETHVVQAEGPVRAPRAPAILPPSPSLGRDGQPLAAGSSIGHYEILRELGRGGMGMVFLARDTRLARLVAVKLLTRLSGDGMKRFLVEARATARCNHENIVTIHEVNEHEGHPYMVLEYIEGQSLRAWMEQRRPPDGGDEISTAPALPDVAAEMIVPAVRALSRAHRAGIIHRDLKPENIMLDASGPIKVVDFGIARFCKEDMDRAPASVCPSHDGHTRLTREGTILGTPPYMSPEHLTGQEIDACSDVWAVGIILHELVLGAHPLAPLTMKKLRSVALPGPMTEVQKRHPELGAIGAIIDRCLQKRKEDRFASAEDLLARLAPLAPGRGEVVLGADESPFAGLSSFQEVDAARFFGRDEALATVISRLRSQPLVTLAGPSGAGKSSLVRAGVIPRLKRSGEPWEALVLRPGREPMAALAELLNHPAVAALAGSPELASLASRTSNEDAPARERRAERLRAEPGYLGALLRAAATRLQRRWVVFVDQFEELFTLGSQGRERVAFLACLEGLADDASSPLRVILAVRSDFVERMAEHTHFMGSVLRGLLFLPPMGREGLREALVKPLEAARYRIEEPAMIDGLLDALEATRGALPLLQFTAAELWDRRDRERRLVSRASYDALGGVAGALSRHADRVLAGMSARQARLARGVLERLVTPERTRALAGVSELCEPPEDGQEIAHVVKLLADARLLSVMQANDGAGDTAEIVHESLIEGWPTLRRWLEENQDDAVFLDRLRGAARLWASSDRATATLWQGKLAEEARAFRERYRGALGERERRYLEAVLRHAGNALRRRRRIVIATISALSLVSVAATVGVLKVTEQKRTIEAQFEEIRRKEGTLLHSLASEEAARNAAEVAREESEAQRRRAEQLRLEAEESRSRAEAEADRARAAAAEARSARDQAQRSDERSRGAEALARQEEQTAKEAAAKERQSRQELGRLVKRAVGTIPDELR
ncbi:nSTAND1 domain-containing NTPase [Sorangium sp. So ce1153]|uniref:serine/threonine protein kinase n=1 Tax=Sorangium sp. So ce1153 TaxID=3133333 RepID=UPI003F5EF155